MEILTNLQGKHRSIEPSAIFQSIRDSVLSLMNRIKSMGFVEKMDDYEKRKLGIFNLLNFFQFLSGIFIPFIGVLHTDRLPSSAWILACFPSFLSAVVLLLNQKQKYQAAQLSYFILYPFFTGFVYLQGMNSGVELHFIFYGILAVFFLQDMGYMIFTIALTMINYFTLSVLLKDYTYEVKHENKFLYFFNHLLALGFIFYALFLSKKKIMDTSSRYFLNKEPCTGKIWK